MQDEITALREERERARKEREQQIKRRRLLLNSQLDPELKVPLPPPPPTLTHNNTNGATKVAGTTKSNSTGVNGGKNSLNVNGTSIGLESTKSNAAATTPSANGKRKDVSKEAKPDNRQQHSLDGRTETRSHSKEQSKQVHARGSHKEKEESTKSHSSSATQLSSSTVIPKNDYSQHFVDTKQRPQNFIRDTGLGDRFEEYVFNYAY